jgi:sporulation protein YlmC with PRC-barrel domain
MENRDETVSLISAGKVQGTNVYNTDGDTLGEVYDVMIDKVSGKVAYAIMSFGGFLGVGERYHPLPWNNLKYDTRQGGYVVGLTRQQLEGAPTLPEPIRRLGAIAPTRRVFTITTAQRPIGPNLNRAEHGIVAGELVASVRNS